MSAADDADQYRAFAASVACAVHPGGVGAIIANHLDVVDLPELLTHLRERLAQVRAEGEAAGRPAERERVLVLVRAAYDAAREVERRCEVLDPSASSGALDVLEQRIEAGEHVGGGG